MNAYCRDSSLRKEIQIVLHMDDSEVLRQLLIIHNCGDNLGNGMLQLVRLPVSHTEGEGRLGIQVHQEYPLSLICQACGQVNGRRGLTRVMRSFA